VWVWRSWFRESLQAFISVHQIITVITIRNPKSVRTTTVRLIDGSVISESGTTGWCGSGVEVESSVGLLDASKGLDRLVDAGDGEQIGVVAEYDDIFVGRGELEMDVVWDRAA
jgi:hypothetical protein